MTPPPLQRSMTGIEAFQEAVRLDSIGRFADAQKLCAQLLKASPNHPEVQDIRSRELNAYDVLVNHWLVFTQATLPGGQAPATLPGPWNPRAQKASKRNPPRGPRRRGHVVLRFCDRPDPPNSIAPNRLRARLPRQDPGHSVKRIDTYKSKTFQFNDLVEPTAAREPSFDNNGTYKCA